MNRLTRPTLGKRLEPPSWATAVIVYVAIVLGFAAVHLLDRMVGP